MIDEVELLLPVSTADGFRERLVAHMEHGNLDPEFHLKANALLRVFEKRFGVNDFFDKPDEE